MNGELVMKMVDSLVDTFDEEISKLTNEEVGYNLSSIEEETDPKYSKWYDVNSRIWCEYIDATKKKMSIDSSSIN
jgi:hypothetical protein